MAAGRTPRSPAIQGRSNALVVAALAALANGIALVAHIVLGVPLPLVLAFTWRVAVVSMLAVTSTGDRSARRALGRIIRLGLLAGILATLVYDATKVALSQLDPSPFNPFEATRIFGTLLIGESASPVAIQAAGWAFHLVNGATFGIAFASLYARFGHDSLRIGLLGGIGLPGILGGFRGWTAERCGHRDRAPGEDRSDDHDRPAGTNHVSRRRDFDPGLVVPATRVRSHTRLVSTAIATA